MQARPGLRPLLLLSAAVLTGCGSAHQGADARVVNVYNWADYIGKDTLAKFESATGIRVV